MFLTLFFPFPSLLSSRLARLLQLISAFATTDLSVHYLSECGDTLPPVPPVLPLYVSLLLYFSGLVVEVKILESGAREGARGGRREGGGEEDEERGREVSGGGGRGEEGELTLTEEEEGERKDKRLAALLIGLFDPQTAVRALAAASRWLSEPFAGGATSKKEDGEGGCDGTGREGDPGSRRKEEEGEGEGRGGEGRKQRRRDAR